MTTITTTNTETNYIDPIDAFIALSDHYEEALRKAAAAALGNYESTWETPENPDTFRKHVLSCGPCLALDIVTEWAARRGYRLDDYLSEYPYMTEEG